MSRVVGRWRGELLRCALVALGAGCGRTSLSDFETGKVSDAGQGGSNAGGTLPTSGSGFVPSGAGAAGDLVTIGGRPTEPWTSGNAGAPVAGRAGSANSEGECQLSPSDCFTVDELACREVRPPCQGALGHHGIITGSRARFTALATSSDGQVAVAGYFEGTLSVDGQSLTGTATNEDGFVLVFDAQRTLRWHHVVGGVGAQAITGVDFTPTGDVVVQGSHDDEPSARADEPRGLGFVERLDGNGETLWSYSVGEGETYPGQLTVDNDGEITLVGGFEDAFAFRSFASNGEGRAGYVVHLDANGEGLWFDTSSPAGWTTSAAQKVVADDEDNLLVVGNGVTPTHLAGSYLKKLGSDGSPLFEKELTATGHQRTEALSVDGKMQVVIGGDFRGDLQVGAVQLKSSGPQLDALWLAKLDREGKWLWAQASDGEADSTSRLGAVATDGLGNIVEARASHRALELRKRRENGALVWTRTFATLAPTSLGLSSGYSGASTWFAGNFVTELSLDGEVLASRPDDSVFLLELGR